VGCGAAVSAGGLFESGFCALSARGAPRCVSCTRRSPTPPPPQGALCAHFGLGFLVWGAVISSVRGAAGGAHQVSIMAIIET